MRKGSPSMKKTDPRADAAPESVTTLESAANGRRGRLLDHRAATAGACRLRRTVCESVGERWRDRAGSLRTVGIP